MKNIIGLREKYLIKSLNIYANSKEILPNLLIENFDFREPFIKACLGVLGN